MDRARQVGRAGRALALAGVLAVLAAGCATGSGPDGTSGGATDGTSPGSDGAPSASGSASASPDPSLSLQSPSVGAGGGADGGATPAPGTAVAADLTVTLDETGSGATTTWHLTCGPDGGDHPDPAGACATLAAAGGVTALAPPRKDVVCTEIYGGPQTAHVEGTVAGTRVSADFSRTNGCGIARWDPLAPLLGSAGGA